MEIDRSPVSIRAAARHLDRCDVVILQHEYGIFGDNDGEAVLEMVDSINRPLLRLSTRLSAHRATGSDESWSVFIRHPDWSCSPRRPDLLWFFALDPEK